MSTDYSKTPLPSAASSVDRTAVPGFSRRRFMADTATLMRGSLLVMSMPAILTSCREAQQASQSNAAFQTLSGLEAAEFSAIAARILPADISPGAEEAGVIHFMDNVIGEESRSDVLIQLREGLGKLQNQIAAEFGESQFHRLDTTSQDAELHKIEATPFFSTLRYLTIAGMLSMPHYGGNRNGIGFDLMQVRDRAAWGPPFGYYDADFMARGA
ncbi:MAG: gluconate 2-dehydrogenase subunit 3 family protein [Gammaproteobacteria bacterium]|nr:gluconate 2-dehydrogenase subunit 3 family protein [Gammaproteobacteria bacterium]